MFQKKFVERCRCGVFRRECIYNFTKSGFVMSKLRDIESAGR